MRTVDELWKENYTVKVGPESEFYLFNTDENARPTMEPQDNAGYFDVAPDDKGENVRREICLTLEEMGLTPESSHHESGPGQNEIDFRFDSPLESADNFVTLKSVVRTIANLNGLYATFMPKPLMNESGSGFHINLSLYKGDKNIFKTTDNQHSKEAESFIAGILYRIKEITAALNPTVNSYRRFGSFEAPKYITWSHRNRSQLIRIPASRGEFSRMELRSADCLCNPYIAFTLLIQAGIEGIREERTLPEAFNKDINEITESDIYETLPENLGGAIYYFKNSTFVKRVLGNFIFDKYVEAKEKEWEQFKSSNIEEKNWITKWETNNYFYKY